MHHCAYVRVHSCCLYFFHSIQCDAVAPRCVCKCWFVDFWLLLLITLQLHPRADESIDLSSSISIARLFHSLWCNVHHHCAFVRVQLSCCCFFFQSDALPTSTTGVIISHWTCVYVRCFSVPSLSVIAFLVLYFICFLLLFHSFQCITHVNHCCYNLLTLCVCAVHCNAALLCILLFGRFPFSVIRAAS